MATTLSEVDATLIQYADTLSPTQISFKIEGILTPTQVAARIATLLDTPDWLTLAQQDQLITMKMRQLVARFEDLPLNARNGEIILRGLEAIGSRLEKRAESTERDLTTLYAFQGVAFLEAVNEVVEFMKGELTETFDQQEKWDDAMTKGIRKAQLSLATHDIDSPEKRLYKEPHEIGA